MAVLARPQPRTKPVSFLVLLLHKPNAVGVHERQDGPDELGKAGVQSVLRTDRPVPQVYAGGNRDPLRGKLIVPLTCMSGPAHIITATGMKQGTTLIGILPMFSRSVPLLQAPSCSRASLRPVECCPRTRIHACMKLLCLDLNSANFHPHGVCHGVASVGVKASVGTEVWCSKS